MIGRPQLTEEQRTSLRAAFDQLLCEMETLGLLNYFMGTSDAEDAGELLVQMMDEMVGIKPKRVHNKIKER